VTWRSFDRLRGGIGPRLLARVLLFSLVSTLILTLSQLYFDYRHDTRAIESRMSEIAGSYRQSLGEGLWNLDRRQLELQIEGILRLPAIRFVEVREATDRADPMAVSGGATRIPPRSAANAPSSVRLAASSSSSAFCRSKPRSMISIGRCTTRRSSS
jgi:hypothetical protein